MESLSEFASSQQGWLRRFGGGNHFLDAIAPYEDGPVYFLIHTGSRNESGHVDNLVDIPSTFDTEFDHVVRWAADNRAAIHGKLELVFGKTELLLDLPHNTYEQLADGAVIIRKGSVRLLPGQLSILPSHMSGDAVLVKAKSTVAQILNSMSCNLLITKALIWWRRGSRNIHTC